MFDNKKQIKARLAADRFFVQNHFDGHGDFNHKAQSIEVNPPLKNNYVENVYYNNYYDAIGGLLSSLDSKVENLNATLYKSGLIRINGDITGTGTSFRVTRIRGQNISGSGASTNNVLRWNGSQWSFATNTPIGTAGGNLSGTYPNPTVTNLTINNQSIGCLLFNSFNNWSCLPPGQANYVLKSNGSGATPTWQMHAGSPGGAAGGGLSGNYPNPEVASVNTLNIQSLQTSVILGNPTNSLNDVSQISLSNGIGFMPYFTGNQIAVGLDNSRNMTLEDHFLNSNLIFFKIVDSQNGATVTSNNDGYAFGTIRLTFGAANDSKITIGTDNICKLIGRETFVCRAAVRPTLDNFDYYFSSIGFFDGYHTEGINNGVFFRVGRLITSSTSVVIASIIKEGVQYNYNFTALLSNDIYYTFQIEILSDRVNYRIFNPDNSLLEEFTYIYLQTASVTIPTVVMYSGVALKKLSSFASKSALSIDYIGITFN